MNPTGYINLYRGCARYINLLPKNYIPCHTNFKASIISLGHYSLYFRLYSLESRTLLTNYSPREIIDCLKISVAGYIILYVSVAGDNILFPSLKTLIFRLKPISFVIVWSPALFDVSVSPGNRAVAQA